MRRATGDPSLVDRRDAARIWSASGCGHLTAPGQPVPTRLVSRVVDLVSRLDRCGAGLAGGFGAAGLGVLSHRARMLDLPAASRGSCGGASRLLEARDGWLAVSIARRSDRELLPAWLGVASDDHAVVTDADPWSMLATIVSGRSATEVVARGIELGLACSIVGERPPGQTVQRRRLGDAPGRPVRGVRVVDLASLWAGPLAADVLRRLGADVVKFEGRGRLDGARATPAWFASMHRGQRSVVLDLSSRSGVRDLERLVLAADVVIEGSRPRALEQLGIDAAAIASSGPQIWVSITGHGRVDAPGRVGFGDDTAAAGGLVGCHAGGPVFLGDALADPLTGLMGATEIIDRLATGGRWLVDLALARCAADAAQRADDPVVEPVRVGETPIEIDRSAPMLHAGAHTAEVMAEIGAD